SGIVLPSGGNGTGYDFLVLRDPKALVAADGVGGGTGRQVILTQDSHLLTGTILVSVQGTTDANQLARINDALGSLSSQLGPYGITLKVNSDSSIASDLSVSVSSTSPCGSASDGILGCAAGSQLTMISGWNWYT